MRLALECADTSEGEAQAFRDLRIAETFPNLLTRLKDRRRPADIVPGLIPGNGMSMIHGQPRALKTWSAMELMRACVMQDDAFGLERFRVQRPYATWYVTEEDPELEVRDRLVSVFAGRNQSPPDSLHLSVHRTIDLDDPSMQSRMIEYGRDHGVQLTILDPIRSLSSAVDQGPREVKPLVQSLRRYMRLTESAVLLVHHDVKPANGKPDARDKPQRMSGGGLFSATDAPIHAELIGNVGSRTLLAPARYKFSITPQPFVVSLESDDPKRPTWVRVQGSEATGVEATAWALHQRIIDYLRENPGSTGSKVATGVRADRARVFSALGELSKTAGVEFSEKGQARLWRIAPRQADSA